MAARPQGYPQASDFQLVETPVPIPGEGELLVRSLYLSVDPYMRGRMSTAESYAAPMQIGEVMVGGAVGRVVASHHPKFQAGDIVQGQFGWQDYALSNGRGVRQVDPTLAPISTSLYVLGMPGLTAYFGLLDIGKPQPGETVFVSGAAGAVGSLVGQIAKIQGCRAVGSAGSDEKVDFLIHELGFDAAFNYKSGDDYYAKLKELCPAGVDVYFDNVGGPQTDAVFRVINVKGRIAICGQISQYNLDKREMGPRLLSWLLIRQARAEGFRVSQFADRYKEGLQQMAQWLQEGKLKYRETITQGLEHAPAAFIGMLQGENIGKQLVKIAEP